MSGAPVFIIGPPRSGTTLLAELLRLHPETSVLTHEAHRFHHDLSRCAARVRAEDHFWYTAADAEEALAGEYREALATLPGLGVVKVSTASIQVDFVRAIFPDAKIVQILREPLDVIASTEDLRRALEADQDHPRLLGPAPDPFGLLVAESFEHPHLRAAASWFFHAVRSELDLRFAGARTYHRLAYRDLLLRPRETLEELLLFLGLPWAEEIDARLGEVSASPGGPGSLGFSTVETQAKSRLDRYAASLGPDIVQAIAPLLELPARLWGFDPGPPPDDDAWASACAHEHIPPGPWLEVVRRASSLAEVELGRFDPASFLFQSDHLLADLAPLLHSGVVVRHEAVSGDAVGTTTVFKQDRRYRFADPGGEISRILHALDGEQKWRELEAALSDDGAARRALERLHGLGMVAF